MTCPEDLRAAGFTVRDEPVYHTSYPCGPHGSDETCASWKYRQAHKLAKPAPEPDIPEEDE